MSHKHVPRPDSTLSAQERSRLRAGLDLKALESLLSRLPPDARALVLEAFDRSPSSRQPALENISTGHSEHRDETTTSWVSPDLVFKDPGLQHLLEQVTVSQFSADPARVKYHEWYQRVMLPARRAPLLLAMPVAWSNHAVVLIVRHAGATPPDMILMDHTRADAPLLDAALSRLVSERCEIGLVPQNPHTIPILVSNKPTRSRTWMKYLVDVLGRLRNERPHDVETVGSARTLEFHIAY